MAPILLIFMRINWLQCMHYFKLHKKTFSLGIFSDHNAKSNTLMLSTKMMRRHTTNCNHSVKFSRCSRLGHPVLWPWIRGPLLLKNAGCFLKLVQSVKTIQYVFILRYSRNYKTLCDRKNLAGGRGGEGGWQRGALCHGINGTMVNPAVCVTHYILCLIFLKHVKTKHIR